VNRFSIELTTALKEYIKSLHPLIRRDLHAALVHLSDTPDAGKLLRGEVAGLWSFKVRRFGVIYRVDDQALVLVAIGPRSTIYEETEKERKKK